MHQLLPLPFVFLVALVDNLEHTYDSPTEPHEPAMNRENPLRSVEHRAVTRRFVKFNVEESVVLAMERESRIRGIEGVDHFDVRVKWNAEGVLP